LSCQVSQAGETEEEGTHGLQPKDAAEDQDSSQDRRQIPSCQGRKGRGLLIIDQLEEIFTVVVGL
jgi:hypothetical protein